MQGAPPTAGLVFPGATNRCPGYRTVPDPEMAGYHPCDRWTIASALIPEDRMKTPRRLFGPSLVPLAPTLMVVPEMKRVPRKCAHSIARVCLYGLMPGDLTTIW